MSDFDPSGLDAAFQVVADGIAQGAFPGAVAAVGDRRGVVSVRAFGHAALEPAPLPMTEQTRIDLASLTKVTAATPAVLQLVDRGAVGLDQPVRSILPDFRHEQVTIRHLMTHTAGLPAWRPLYLQHRGWEEYTAAISSEPLVREPGTAVEYSDLGFILLGAIVMAVSGNPFDRYCRDQLFRPLGMAETSWRPPGSPDPGPDVIFAATERLNGFEQAMAGEPGARFGRWRDYQLCGEVHDGNAWYGLDGISSHAGLFAPIADLCRYAVAWLRQALPGISPATAALATSLHTSGMNEARGLGWAKPPAASAGARFSPAAFGHTGFTGTSLWIDPDLDLFAILLTNRVHPVAREGIMPVRRAFHEALVAARTGGRDR